MSHFLYIYSLCFPLLFFTVRKVIIVQFNEPQSQLLCQTYIIIIIITDCIKKTEVAIIPSPTGQSNI